jgi:uncharacterized protein YndB with AHSA1/START domain
MHRVVHGLIGFFVAAALLCPARAEVNDAAPNGFAITQVVHVAAPPEAVYAALIVPSSWWSARHTFSGSAANLTLDPKAGGCWCEKLGDGASVQHMTAVFVLPNKKLVLRGALGPLQGLGVDGAMTIDLKPEDGGTELHLAYNVGGFLADGLESWAKPVDGVLAEQFGRLKTLIETGSPDLKTETAP